MFIIDITNNNNGYKPPYFSYSMANENSLYGNISSSEVYGSAISCGAFCGCMCSCGNCLSYDGASIEAQDSSELVASLMTI